MTPKYRPEDVPDDLIRAAAEYANTKGGWPARPDDSAVAQRAMVTPSTVLECWTWGRAIVEFVDAEMAKRAAPTPPTWRPEDVPEDLIRAAIKCANHKCGMRPSHADMPDARSAIAASTKGHAIEHGWAQIVVRHVNAEMAKRQPPTPAPSPAPAVTVVYTVDVLAASLRAVLDYAWPDGTTGPACVRAARAALDGAAVPVTPAKAAPREIDDTLIREAVKFANKTTHGAPLGSDVERVRDALENGVGGMWSACAVGYVRGATAVSPKVPVTITLTTPEPDYRALYEAEVEAHVETQADEFAKAREIDRLKSALAKVDADLARATDRILGLQNRLDNIRAELADP